MKTQLPCFIEGDFTCIFFQPFNHTAKFLPLKLLFPQLNKTRHQKKQVLILKIPHSPAKHLVQLNHTEQVQGFHRINRSMTLGDNALKNTMSNHSKVSFFHNTTLSYKFLKCKLNVFLNLFKMFSSTGKYFLQLQ